MVKALVSKMHRELNNVPSTPTRLTAILELTRRMRWECLEPAHARLADGTVSESTVPRIIGDLEQRLTRLEGEAKTYYGLLAERVESLFPHRRVCLDRMRGDYTIAREKLMQARREGSATEGLEAVAELERLCKSALLIALEGYQGWVDSSLSPLDVRLGLALRRHHVQGGVWERLGGVWKGTARDIDVPDELVYETRKVYDLELSFGAGGSDSSDISIKVTGTDKEGARTFQPKIDSVHASEDSVFLVYSIEDAPAHYGLMMLRLDGYSQSLAGYFLATKLNDKADFVFGKVELSR